MTTRNKKSNQTREEFEKDFWEAYDHWPEEIKPEALSLIQKLGQLFGKQKTNSDTKRGADYTFPNDKRDARILELRQEGKSFREVADVINREFPKELVDEISARLALKRYCARSKNQYPYGPRGRKPNM